MQYIRTLSRSVLAQCHHCEWWHEADDSEFPSRFLFDLAYQFSGQEIVLRGIEPRAVIACDLQGRPLYQHEFTARERPEIWLWFDARLRLRLDTLLERMAMEIDRDCQARRAADEAIFAELLSEGRGLMAADFQALLELEPGCGT